MSNNITTKQENKIAVESQFKIWSDSRDWCQQCHKEKVIQFNEQTKTTHCPQCGHTETYKDDVWRVMQAQRYVSYQYMPGKYFFSHLSKEEIFQKYLRELNHNDWTSWLIHDYVLAKMRNDKAVQDKLLETAKQIIEKMSYDPKPWNTLFEKMNDPDPEMFHQVPQIIYEFVEKKLHEMVSKEDFFDTIEGYIVNLTNIYCYSRWKNDRAACWIINEIIKLCDTPDSESIDFYTEYFGCDPLLTNFKDDLVAGKKCEISIKDSYIQWELNLANVYLQQSSALVAVQSAYEALSAKLGIHAIWPPTKILPFDISTVKKVSEIVNDPELFRLYDLATDLNSIDAPKACFYAKNFIEKVKKMLPDIIPIEQELAKQTAYIA
ncbi:MAG: hypothetical protein LBE76_03745 [Nitrososphaerota archaeon]|jgi:predicted RNA-binding Zn-ribbon protein involved in translation (DUF1610 family)|nr:hypothetical protein [Nitrososphaerota archaeon]